MSKSLRISLKKSACAVLPETLVAGMYLITLHMGCHKIRCVRIIDTRHGTLFRCIGQNDSLVPQSLAVTTGIA
jgi:hypothetical protein